MALMELIARLGINTTNFEVGLKRARSVAQQEAHGIQHLFIGVGLSLLGVHGISRTIRHVSSEIIRWSQDIDKAREEFQRLGIEVDEGALKSIRAMGFELERLKVDVARGLAPVLSGIAETWFKASAGVAKLANFITHPFDSHRNNALNADIQRYEEARLGLHTEQEQAKQKQDLESVRTLHKQIAEQEDKNRLAGLEGEAKLLELTKQRLGFLQLIMNGRLNERQTLESALSALKLTGEMDSFTRDQFKAHPVQLREKSLDALNKIGGFAQGGKTPETKAVDRISLNTEITAKNTITMAQALETIKNKTWDEGFRGHGATGEW